MDLVVDALAAAAALAAPAVVEEEDRPMKNDRIAARDVNILVFYPKKK
jgi:hypothetical protein